MKVFVTGVGGQLGHDIMNELHKRGHQGVGSDLAPVYSGIADRSAVTTMPYVSLDITEKCRCARDFRNAARRGDSLRRLDCGGWGGGRG